MGKNDRAARAARTLVYIIDDVVCQMALDVKLLKWFSYIRHNGAPTRLFKRVLKWVFHYRSRRCRFSLPA